MTDSNSSFTPADALSSEAVPLHVASSTSQCFMVRLYGKQLFMKRLKPELAGHPQYRAALQKEFETGFRLDHPNLARYISRGEDYVLMEYVEGETLAQFAQTHPDFFRNSKKVSRMLNQLLSVVGYLHANHVLHLDLKPQNILISRLGNDVMLVDLGFCHTDTYPDTTGRTDHYAAPEQMVAEGTLGEYTDIYAIGRILQTLPLPSHKYNKVIARCVEIEPGKRFQNIGELENALKPKRWTLPAALALVCAAAVLLVLLLWKPQPSAIPSSQDTLDTVRQEQPAALQQKAENQPPPASVQPAPQPKEAAPTPAPQQEAEDTMQLRRELKEDVEPLFEKHLGAYRHVQLGQLDQPALEQFGKQEVAFQVAAMSLQHTLWEKYKGRYTRQLYLDEFNRTCQTFIESLAPRQ